MVAQIDLAFFKTRPRKIWPRLLAYFLFEGRPLTTRGRWINPLVFAGMRIWSLLPLRTRDQNPIFILGVGRSGTTILGKILALHEDVGYLNEPKALWHAALGDDDLIGSYADAPGRYRMSEVDALPTAKRRLRRSYSAFLGLSRCRRVVDKYPELIFRTRLVDAVFPGARKIVLIRNGLDTCRSIQRWSQENRQTSPRQSTDWWGKGRRKWHLLVEQLVAPDPAFASSLPIIRTFSRHDDMAAVEWIVTMRQALALQNRKSENLLFIRYEDLLARPKEVLSNLLDFCELPPDGKMLRYALDTLRLPKPHAELSLNPAIAGLFDTTMKSLGYAHERKT